MKQRFWRRGSGLRVGQTASRRSLGSAIVPWARQAPAWPDGSMSLGTPGSSLAGRLDVLPGIAELYSARTANQPSATRRSQGEARCHAGAWRSQGRRDIASAASDPEARIRAGKFPHPRWAEDTAHRGWGMVTLPGFEPGMREPKSLVLPLHHRVVVAIACGHCAVNQWRR